MMWIVVVHYPFLDDNFREVRCQMFRTPNLTLFSEYWLYFTELLVCHPSVCERVCETG